MHFTTSIYFNRYVCVRKEPKKESATLRTDSVFFVSVDRKYSIPYRSIRTLIPKLAMVTLRVYCEPLNSGGVVEFLIFSY